MPKLKHLIVLWTLCLNAVQLMTVSDKSMSANNNTTAIISNTNSFNYGNSVATPTPSSTANASNIHKIVLGLESALVRNVPEQVEVQLTCRFVKPMWYRAGQLLASSIRTITLRAVRKQDAGVYSCYAPAVWHGMKWSNLTLNVVPSRQEDDIADWSKVEDEEGKELVEPQVDLGEVEYVTAAESTVATLVTLKTAEEHPNLALGPPKFKTRLNSRAPNAPRFYRRHDALFLNCPANGNPLPEITWLLNDTIIVAAGSHKYTLKKWSLLLEDLRLEDTGSYKCVVCNKYGCIEDSTDVRVRGTQPWTNIQVLPQVPQNVTVPLHAQAQFECRVQSSYAPPIVWVKHRANNKNIAELERELSKKLQIKDFLKDDEHFVLELPRNVSDPSILHLNNAQLHDEGWYTCVSYANVTQMHSAYLKVLQNDTQVPQSEGNVETERVAPVITVTVNDKVAAKPKMGKLLQKQTMPLELDSLNAQYLNSTPGIDKTKVEENNGPENKGSAETVAEESAPRFKKTLEMNLRLPAGSSVLFSCPFTGNPMPNITWTRDNKEVTRHIGAVNYRKFSMVMADAITEDSGSYKCTVCNKLGCIEHAYDLRVLDRLRSRPIHSDMFPRNTTVEVNKTAILDCRVMSDLEPHLIWIKYTRKNASIRDLERLAANALLTVPEQQSRDFVKLPTVPDKPNVLRWENVSKADEGWYTCIAANALGKSMASAYLRVVDVLPSREVYNLVRNHPILLTTVAVVVISLFLLGSIFIIYVLRKLKHEKLLKHRIETVHQWTKKVIIYKPASCDGSSSDLQVPVIKIEKQRTTFQTSMANVDRTQAFNEYEFPLDSNWEIARSHLVLGSTLGEGAFGRVVMAEASGLPRTVPNNASNSTVVAVKMVKDEHTDADMASLVREMEVMKIIGKHINIINLLGCCTQSGPLWVIVEFAPHGNLKDFLKKNRPLFVGSPSLQRNSSSLEEKPDPPLTEKSLTSFAFQIARGMEYLASRRCIHRDLAARNVLVSDDYVMKIADFGLARDIQDTDYYRKNTNGRLPIKWMAPESLQEKFYDSQSDVWSFGVLLWEIMTYGEQPYPNIMSAEELYSYLMTGQRMEKPPRCTLNNYMLMRQCWHFDASARPTFCEIVENLEKILQSNTAAASEDYLELSIRMLETPPSSSDEESDPETFQETSPLRYQYTYKFN